MDNCGILFNLKGTVHPYRNFFHNLLTLRPPQMYTTYFLQLNTPIAFLK